MNKMVVGVILTIGVVVASTTIVFADGVVIPGSIKVEKFREEMKSHGMDLYGKDSSDGDIENKGNAIKVITYKPVTIEQMDWMKDAAAKSVRD